MVDIVDDFLTRGSESKEEARLSLRAPEGDIAIEPWVDEMSVLLCLR